MKNKFCIESPFLCGSSMFRDLFDMHMSPPQREYFKFDPLDGATNAAPDAARSHRTFQKSRNVGLSMSYDLMHQAGMELHSSELLVDTITHTPMGHCKRKRIRKKYRNRIYTTTRPSRQIIKMRDPITGREKLIMHPALAEELKARLMKDYHDKQEQAFRNGYIGMPQNL